MPCFRPRISLLAALLLMTIVGMAIVLVQLWQEVEPLRAEVRRLRDEVGELFVDDPKKVHAIEIDTKDELTWKWRVWIPENSVYVVRCSGENVPKEGFPPDGGTIWLREPGEQVLVYRIRRNPRNDNWYGGLEAGSSRVSKNDHPWVKWSRQSSTSEGVGDVTRAFELGRRIELLRHRVSQVNDSSKIEDPAAGFMIWLEPSK